jgi:AraC-like DNA-binding protein
MELVDETRRARAEDLLARPNLKLTELAFALGFSEHSAFTRAFRRWFGVSPRDFRRRPPADAPLP